MSDEPKKAFGVSATASKSSRGIGERRLQVPRSHLRAAGVPVVALEGAWKELDAISLRLPPGDAAVDLGAGLRRTPRRDDSDHGAWRRGAGKDSSRGPTVPFDRRPDAGPDSAVFG